MSTPCGHKKNTETVAQYRKRCGGRPLGMIMKMSEGDDKVELIKLYNKAMKMMPGSPNQKKIKKQISALRKKLKMDETPRKPQTKQESVMKYCRHDECAKVAKHFYTISEKKDEPKRDKCYHKVKARYDVWPSAYASSALVKCRQVGADVWGEKSKKDEGIDMSEHTCYDCGESIDINEAGFKFVIRKGKKVKKLICPPGSKAVGKRKCKRMGGQERLRRLKGLKITRRKAKTKLAKTLRKRAKSMKKRSRMGLKTESVNLQSYDIYSEDGKWGYTMDGIVEAEYKGRKVELGKIMQGDQKKFKVYVKNDKGNVVPVHFGQGGDAKGGTMRIRKSNAKARKSFRARHNCDNPGPRWKARYWSCKKW